MSPAFRAMFATIAMAASLACMPASGWAAASFVAGLALLVDAVVAES